MILQVVVSRMDISGPSPLGLMGSLNVLLAALLVILGVVLLFIAKSRKTFHLYCATAFIPILIGGLGSLLSYHHINAIAAASPRPLFEEEWAAARPYIRVPAYAGLGCGAAILIVGSLGIITRAPHERAPEEDETPLDVENTGNPYQSPQRR